MLLDANPELQKLLQRKEKLEMRKLIEKRESKKLTDVVLMNEIRVRDRKIYKQYIKNPLE